MPGTVLCRWSSGPQGHCHSVWALGHDMFDVIFDPLSFGPFHLMKASRIPSSVESLELIKDLSLWERGVDRSVSYRLCQS